MKSWIVPSLYRPDKTCFIIRDDGVEVEVNINKNGRFVKFTTNDKSYLTMAEMVEIHDHYQMTQKIDME